MNYKLDNELRNKSNKINELNKKIESALIKIMDTVILINNTTMDPMTRKVVLNILTDIVKELR